MPAGLTPRRANMRSVSERPIVPPQRDLRRVSPLRPRWRVLLAVLVAGVVVGTIAAGRGRLGGATYLVMAGAVLAVAALIDVPPVQWFAGRLSGRSASESN